MNGMSSLPSTVLTINPLFRLTIKQMLHSALLYIIILEINSGCFSLLRKKNFRTSYPNMTLSHFETSYFTQYII